jgi:hypothetical protein
MFANWMKRGPKPNLRTTLRVETMEDRAVPASFAGDLAGFTGGLLAVSPPGGAAHVMDHFHPDAGVGGLNTAEAQSGVVIWTPTDPG